MFLTINGFRGFKSVSDVRIAPLTILVGENSAGKTSFLAAVRYIHEIFQNPEIATFNKEPFLLGAYDQIAHYRGGKPGRERSFSFKIKIPIDISEEYFYFKNSPKVKSSEKNVLASCEIEFANEFSTPALRKVTLDFQGGEAVIERSSSGGLSIKANNFEKTVDEDPFLYNLLEERIIQRNIFLLIQDLPFAAMQMDRSRRKVNQSIEKLDAISARFRLLKSFLRRSIYASALVRTEPVRAYTPLDASPSPQGAHVPYLLARLKRHDTKKWELLKEKIDKFGSQSGMFNKIDVKNLGRTESDPFQIYFDFGGPKRNIIDVGYGISQVLPLIAETMMRDNPTTFLFQQPEVHLHPQAQAALGTFFAEETARGPHSFIIESHSDYIIDRARMAVRDRSLKPDHVNILYFRKGRLESEIFQISIDENGNLLNAPEGYRQFFLDEAERSIGNDYNS